MESKTESQQIDRFIHTMWGRIQEMTQEFFTFHRFKCDLCGAINLGLVGCDDPDDELLIEYEEPCKGIGCTGIAIAVEKASPELASEITWYSRKMVLRRPPPGVVN